MNLNLLLGFLANSRLKTALTIYSKFWKYNVAVVESLTSKTLILS